MTSIENAMLIAARREVLLDADAECTPAIDLDDVETAIVGSARAHVWEASTAYQYGDMVQPAIRNGHRYRCLAAGISGSSSPTFPSGQHATVTDGDDIVWVEDGPDYRNVYDVRAALESVWFQKAEKASGLVDSREGGASSKIQAQCLERAKGYAPLVIA